jgi:hypothetical protein
MRKPLAPIGNLDVGPPWGRCGLKLRIVRFSGVSDLSRSLLTVSAESRAFYRSSFEKLDSYIV